MLRQHLQSISKWYRTIDWEAAGVTILFACAFGALGVTMSEYFDIARVINQGYRNQAVTLTGAVFIGIPAGVFVGAIALLSERLLAALPRVNGVRPTTAHVVVPICSGVLLSWGLLLLGGEVPKLSWLTDLAGGLFWWLFPLVWASVGIRIRRRWGQSPPGTAFAAITTGVVMLLLVGSALGAATVPPDSQTTIDSEHIDDPENRSAYVDGEYGPAMTAEMKQSETDPVPLQDSAFACSSPPEVSEYTIGDQPIPLAATEQTDVADRMQVTRYRFENGTLVPNRAELTVSVPSNATLIRGVSGTAASPGEGDSLHRRLHGEYSWDVQTEWTEPGVVILEFGMEDGEIHRYYAAVCPSEEVT